ncbi:MAG: DUF2283 domain-containing protein [Pseudonocardiaceae bacterium]
MSHYDRDADIVWLELPGFDSDHLAVQEAEWGLVERDSETGAIVAVEFWKASRILPRELLEGLPAPAEQAEVVDQQSRMAEVPLRQATGD